MEDPFGDVGSKHGVGVLPELIHENQHFST